MSGEAGLILHPPRLPESFAAPGPADLLAAFGLGILLAALILTIAGPLMTRRSPRVPLATRIAESRSLAPHDRALELARLAAQSGQPLPEALRAGLYSPAPPDSGAMEDLLRRRRIGRGSTG